MNGDYLQSGITPQPNSYYPMGNMQGSTYAAPLNYNQPKEVVGGYDAKINPMTGQEIPEVNFAGGGLASLANSPYADSDVMNVQMTPREVSGLQQLAVAYGANERDLYDPVTGQPRFSFLKKILPMVAGALLGPAGFGKLSPFMAATTVGLGYGLIEGDLKKGLTAGLSAYSGASITGGLKEAAGVSSQVKAAPPASSLKDTAFKISTDSVGQDLPLSSLRQAPISTVTGKPMMPVQTVTQAPPLPTPSPPPSGFFGTQAQGLRNVFTTREGADAFMRGMSGGSTSPFGQAVGRYATIAGALIPFAEEPKPLNVPSGDDIVYIPGQPNPLYGTGANQPPQLPGKYYKRTPQGLVPYDPWASGGRGYAEGGAVGVVPGSTGDTASPITAPDEDALVRANREYVEELNRRAMNPVLNPYGMIAAGGGLGGTNQPWSGLSPYGTPISSGAGTTSEAAGAGAGDIAAFLGTQIGINWLMQPGNAVALKDWIAGGMKGPNPFFKKDEAKPPEETKPAETTTQPPADTTVVNPAAITSGLSGIASTLPGAGESTSTVTVETPENTPSGDVAPSQPSSTVVNPAAITSGLSGIASTLPNKFTTALPYVGEPVYDAAGNMTGFKYPDGRFEPAEGYTKEPGQLDSDLQARTRVPDTSAPLSNYLSGASALGSGLTALAPAAAPVATGLTSILPVGSEEVIQSIVSPGSSAAANAAAAETAGADVAGTEATAGTEGIGGKIIPGLQTALGLYGAYKGIESGNEAQAALGGYGAATGLAALKVFGAKPAIGALAGAGPIGLAAAAIAAIGASLVNTKEYGDVALRNYWNAVDQGRGFGSAPPEELAQGFINFYRTNKNQFAGQEKYGRTGNEDFVYDMTQVINDAVKSGKVGKDVDATTMYKEVVQPWLNSMGSGPQDADARRIQDFMMTDLIHNFMQGKPISNAQVKGDKKFKIVSERPVYAGAAQPEAEPAYGPVGGMNAPESPFAEERREERRDAREMEREAIMPVRGTEAVNPFTTSTVAPTTASTALAPAAAPVQLSEKQKQAVVDSLPPEVLETIMQGGNPFAEQAELNLSDLGFYAGGAIGDDYNFGFAHGGMPGEYKAGGRLLNGPGDGMSDSIPAVIRGKGVQRAALADGEFVIPADVVSHLGNGSTNAGAKKLHRMMARIRQARTGRTRQAPEVRVDKFLPA